MEQLLLLSRASKSFNSTLVIEDMSLSVGPGESLAILGPSGCGKTTLLRLAAGLLDLDTGIRTGLCLLPGPGQLSYLPQDSLLLPWRTLEQNALLPSEIWHLDQAIAREHVRSMFAELHLLDALDALPVTASGGMARRAAFIRCLVGDPKVLLLDEPFTGFDYDIKIRAQQLLVRHLRRNQGALLLVTHDIEDAIALCDTLLIISARPGRIKTTFDITTKVGQRDPLEIRGTPQFGALFTKIWNALQNSRQPTGEKEKGW